MKMNKKIIILLLTSTFLYSCGTKYVSSYSAILFTRHQSTNKGSASFKKFKGTYVFKIKTKFNNKQEGTISYNAEIKEGERFTVYYDCYDVKEELFTITANEKVSNTGGYIENGRYVYVIMEASEFVEGSISFSFI